jgi:hypothetical protein
MTPAPDFFVIGAYRSGTTALYRYMRQHPDVFLPLEKEPNFYAVDGNPDASTVLLSRSLTTRAEYDRYFADAAPSQRRGDISPEYLRNPAAAPRIRRDHPDTRLVAILRNPVDRAWSDFLLHRRDGNEPCESLRDALADQERRQRDGDHRAGHYVDSGMYHAQLQRYLEHFSREQLLVLLYDDLTRDRHASMRAIFGHVGVDPSFVTTDEEAINASGVPTSRAVAYALRTRAKLRPYVSRSVLEKARPHWDRFLSRNLSRPELSDADRELLCDLYRDEIAALGTLLDRDLSQWLETSTC